MSAAFVAALDWWAVGSARRRIERVAKPATMALLLTVAAFGGDAPGDVRGWLIIGACFGVVGDVALLGDDEWRFMVGLGSFAVGHLAYTGAAISVGFDPVLAAFGAMFTSALLAYRFVPRTLPGARAHGGAVLASAVMLYAVVISAMVVTAWATSLWVAAAGASLFAVSDWVLGYQRFVGPLPGGRLSVMVPYHVGQALLIVALATA